MLGVKEVRTMIKKDEFDNIKDLFKEGLTKKAHEEALQYLYSNIERCKEYLGIDTKSREFRLEVKKLFVNKKLDYVLDTAIVTEYKKKHLVSDGCGRYNERGDYTILEEALREYVKEEAKKHTKKLKTRIEQLRKALELFYNLIREEENYIPSWEVEGSCKYYNIASIQQAKQRAKEYKKTDEYKNKRRKQIFLKLYGKTLKKYNITRSLKEKWFSKKWLENLKKEIVTKKNLIDKYGKIPCTIEDIKEVLKEHSGYCEFLDTLVKVNYTEDRDYNYYSKSWHRTYGAKITIVDRRVTFYKKDFEKTIYIDKFAGDFILKAYIEAFKIKKYKQKGFARKVQLQDHFRAKKIKKVGEIEIWERTVNKIHYDYCAVLNKTTYHAKSVKEAIDGVQNKIQTKLDFGKEELCWEDAKKLGFCDTGIESFCEVNNLDYKKCYTREFLKKVVANNRDNNKRFKEELLKIKIW